MIQFIAEKDRQVLRELLTTDHYFVDIEYDQDEVAFQPSYFQPSNGNNPVRSSPSTPRCTAPPRRGLDKPTTGQDAFWPEGRYIDPSGMAGSLERKPTTIPSSAVRSGHTYSAGQSRCADLR